ncbi:hypothetical protein ACLIA0_10135 [Bacillaceae bacterium W0354]
MSEEKQTLVDIWGDNVDIKDLIIAMTICIAFTLGGYIIAPGESPQPLIFGLVGGVIGFIISSIIIKPKRNVKVEGVNEDGSDDYNAADIG